MPKNLRILEEITFEGNAAILEKPGTVKLENQNIGQTVIEAQYDPPMAIIPEDDYENRFYSSFDFKFDEPEDPFVTLGRKNVEK